MSRDTQAPLKAFEHLPAEEKHAFSEELLRRSLPFDSGPLEDEEIGAASVALFETLEEKDADPSDVVRASRPLSGGHPARALLRLVIGFN